MSIRAIWKGVRLVGKAKPLLDAGMDARAEIVGLWGDWKSKWDTDGDGKPDLSPAEATEFLGKVLVVVAKRL